MTASDQKVYHVGVSWLDASASERRRIQGRSPIGHRAVRGFMTRQTLVSLWAIAGVSALLLRALVSLTPYAVDALVHYHLAPPQWALLLGWVAFNAYAEGVVGFHQKFAPRVVRRALELGRRPSFVRVLFGAPYAIGLFAAPKRTLVTSWSVLAMIVGLVVSVRFLSQPWRGIVDAGVVVGLAIGLGSLLYRFGRELRSSGVG